MTEEPICKRLQKLFSELL